jgi:hypothetical protein
VAKKLTIDMKPEAIEQAELALAPFGMSLIEYVRASVVLLLVRTDEARTDLVNEAILMAKMDTVEVREKTFAMGKPGIKRINVDVRGGS